MNKPERLAKQHKIIRIGNSAGIILQKDELDLFRLKIGVSLSCSQPADGFWLSAKDPEFDRQMAAAKSIMKRYRNALSELAKRHSRMDMGARGRRPCASR